MRLDSGRAGLARVRTAALLEAGWLSTVRLQACQHLEQQVTSLEGAVTPLLATGTASKVGSPRLSRVHSDA